LRVAKRAATCKNFRSATLEVHSVIALTVNGVARRFEEPLNCSQLLERLELAGKRVALERNGEIVPRGRHANEMLADGDKLEIVVAVGGG
jgi:sulfur carrier protein